MMNNNIDKCPLSLYLHFPFCIRKCRYCDFLSFPADSAARNTYLKRLVEEVKFRGADYRDYLVKTVFIGGGTPSLMTAEQIEELFEVLHQSFHIAEDAEISMECNPGTVNLPKLQAMKKAGINRISFGLQSMNDQELAYLGRIHDTRSFLKSYQDARTAGFDNINIDLMSALPGQTVDSYRRSLEQVLELEPEHISAYSLIIEEGTPFWKLYGEEHIAVAVSDSHDILPLPDEDAEREMYHLTKRILHEHGYDRYEISNYAKKGRECRHNLVYWERGDYLGLGLGSASMVQDKRFTNAGDMEKYHVSFKYEDEQFLSKDERMEETMFLGLRLTEGVSLEKFEAVFGSPMTDIYGDVINKYLKMRLLTYNEKKTRIFLTEEGMDVANPVMADFLL